MTKHSLIAASCAAVSLLLLAPEASALVPLESDLITDVTLQVPARASIEEETAFVGIEHCVTMINRQSEVAATFTTAFNPQSNEESLFDDVNFFNVERDSTARIDCQSGELCVIVEDEGLDFGVDSITVELPFTELVGFDDPAECTGFDREFFLRVAVFQDIGSDQLDFADARIVVDTIRPSAPGGLVAQATENKLLVEFEGSAEEDVKRYAVFYSTEPFDGGAYPGDLDLQSKPLGDADDTEGDVVVDLPAGETVYIAVAAQDMGGNFSLLSGVVETEVVATRDFWEAYKEAGGTEDGGCATGGRNDAPLLALLIFGATLFFQRRRNRR